LLTVRSHEDIAALKQRALSSSGIVLDSVGIVGGKSLCFGTDEGQQLGEIPLADLRRAHEGFFPALMGADAVLA
ncbi:MAG TPA: hypothetical protein VFL92_02480, partial [Sphingomonas sp.]|nr:hypothetical protein [Sphingomonas sp.]